MCERVKKWPIRKQIMTSFLFLSFGLAILIFGIILVMLPFYKFDEILD